MTDHSVPAATPWRVWGDLRTLLGAHPTPWRIVEGDVLCEAASLTMLDVDGGIVFAVAGSGPLGDPANAQDWAVARALYAAVIFAVTGEHPL